MTDQATLSSADQTRSQDRAGDDAPVTSAKHIHSERTLIGEVVTIARPPAELYEYWRRPAKLAGILENVVAIEELDDRRSRWRVKAPGGKEVSWIAAITHDEPGRSLNWQSEDGGDIANSGKVSFAAAGDRGTVVRAVIAYEPPAGAIGKLVAKLFRREPSVQTRRDLHRFKQFMETGEIATSARNQREAEERDGGND